MITQKEIDDFIKKIDYEHYKKDTVTKEERQIIRKALNNNDIILTGYNSKAVRNIVGVFNAEITLTICHQLPDPEPMTEDEPLYEVCLPICMDEIVIDELDKMIKDKYEKNCQCFLYCRPDQLDDIESFTDRINTIIVDDCLDVTEWGYEKSKEYQKIGDFIQSLEYHPTIIAATSYAEKTDCKKIEDALGMTNTKVCHLDPPFDYSFAKEVRSFSTTGEKDRYLYYLLNEFISEGCVVYCETNDDVLRVYKMAKTWFPKQVAIIHPHKKCWYNQRDRFEINHKKILVTIPEHTIRRILLKDAEIAVIHFTYPRSMREHINAVMKIEEDTVMSYVLYDEEDYQRMKRSVSNSSKRIKKAFSEIENMK